MEGRQENREREEEKTEEENGSRRCREGSWRAEEPKDEKRCYKEVKQRKKERDMEEQTTTTITK